MKNIVMRTLLASLVFAGVCKAEITKNEFGKTRDGNAVELFTITNKSGASAKVMTYGAVLVSLQMPDRDGKRGDVVLGFDRLEDYLKKSPYFGAIVGRYGNRIGGATFKLGEAVFKLDANENGNTLHGGRHGFDKALWAAVQIDSQTIELTYLSKDGEEGFPGNLTTHVRYSLTDENELKIQYTDTTDKDTVLNLTHHSYFNLAGEGSPSVLDHELTIDADAYTPVDAKLIPTGELKPVAGTAFDFRQAHTIGERIDADDSQLKMAGGYDQNFVLNHKEGLGRAALVYEPTSGRVMEVWTTEPGLQFYSSNGLRVAGKGGKMDARRSALCLETQHFPDSPNKAGFPSTVLKAGDTYQSTTVYRFRSKAH
jgi:aldose 1-epimerase